MEMATEIRPWTLDELHRLPDDGNKYELVRGELFVTPAPAPDHEIILANLTRCLGSFVTEHGLGAVFHPRAVVRFGGSEVEPDLMVRRPAPTGTPWEKWPTPILVVEVISPTTRRRDHEQKRDFYLDVGVDEYWILDPETRVARVVGQGRADRSESTEIVWSPSAASEPLRIALADVFPRVPTRAD